MLRGICSAIVLALLLAGAPSNPASAQDGSPAPVASPILIDPLDPRAGDGASSVGAPLLALLVVLALGGAAAGLTYAYIAVARRR